MCDSSRYDTMIDEIPLGGAKIVPEPLTSFLFTAGVPRPPGSNPDLRAQAHEVVDTPGRLRASWDSIVRRLRDEGHEAGEFALVCRVHLNLLDNCVALLEVLGRSNDPSTASPDKLRNAAAEIKALQSEIRPLYELATRKPPPLDPEKIRTAESKHAGEQAVEVGELLRQIQAGEIEL